MNTITINFENGADINAAYSQIKKLYPKNKITKNSKEDEARVTMELQESMEGELKKLGIGSEEEFIDWINGVIKETRRERRGESII